MSIPKFKPNSEIKNQTNQPQQKEDLSAQAATNIDHINDQFLNEKAIDIESLAHRVFGTNPAILNVEGEAYILHADGTKTFLKPEELNKVHLQQGDVIVTGPEASVIIEAAEKQCVIDGNNQLLVDKALLTAINPADAACPGSEILENEGHSHNLVFNEHWQIGDTFALFGTLSGEYSSFLTDSIMLSELNSLSSLFNALRGGGQDEAVLFAPAQKPTLVEAPLPPVIPDDGNDAPVALDSVATGNEDQPLVFAMSMFNSTDKDIGDSIESIMIDSLPVNGSLELFDPDSGTSNPVTVGMVISADDINDGNLRFIPASHESGDDSFSIAGVGNQSQDYASFSFSVHDGIEASSNSATMTINITPVADAPDIDPLVPQPQQEFNPLYIADGNGPGQNGTSIYSVEFNNITDQAELTLVYNTADDFLGSFLSDAQMAVSQDGSRIFLVSANGGPTPQAGYYDTTTGTFTVFTLNIPGLDAGGMGSFVDTGGNEFLYIADRTSNTLISFTNAGGVTELGPTYGPFELVDTNGDPTGTFYNFDDGDIIFDEFDNAYAISNSLNDPTGGFALLNFETGTAQIIQNFSDWNQTAGGGLEKVTSLHYDEATQLFYVGINDVGGNSTYNNGVTNIPVGSAFITLNKDGTYSFPNGSNNPPTMDMTLSGVPFDHSAGDSGSAVTAEYVIPLAAHLGEDADGSEALLSLSLTFSDNVDGHVDGAAVVFNGQVLVDNGQILLDSNLGSNSIPATVSIDPNTQTWTFTVVTPDPAITDLGGNFAIRVGLAQSNDFSVTSSSTAIELSNGDTATTTGNSTTIPVNFTPEIIDGAAQIIHDEDSFNQPGTNDVDFLNIPSIFNSVESDLGLSSADRLGAAQTPMGVFTYKAPGGDYIDNISLVQADGSLFNGQDSGIQTPGSNNIFLYHFDDDGGNRIILGREGNGAVADSSGDVIFAIYLDPGEVNIGSPNDSVWLVTYGEIENALAPAEITNLIHLAVTTNDGDTVVSPDSIDVTIFENDNDAPVSSDSTLTVLEDTPTILTLADFPSTDLDVGDAVEGVRITSLPTSGTLEFFNNGLGIWTPVTVNQLVTAAQINAGRLRYNPDQHESGDESFGDPGTGDQQNDYATFTFRVSDGQVLSNISTVTIDVTPVADAPTMSVNLATRATTFSTAFLVDAGSSIPNPDYDPLTDPSSDANIGGVRVAGAALYTITFNDNGTPDDIFDDTVDLVFVADFWSLQNPTADQNLLNQWIDNRLQDTDNPLAPFDEDNPPANQDISDVGYSVAAIAAVLDGTQIFALDDTGSNVVTSRLDFGFYDISDGSFTNISGPPDTVNTPDGIGHAPNSTTASQGMTFFGGSGQQQIFVYNVSSDQVQAYDISDSLTGGSDPFNPANLIATYGEGGGLGFKIIQSPDHGDIGAGDADNDGRLDGAPDGKGDYDGMYYDITGGDIVFDQYDRAYMISNSRYNINTAGGNTDQVGGFAQLNLEEGTAVLLNDFRDTFNLFNDSDNTQPGIQLAYGLLNPGGLFLNAEANNGDGLFYVSLSGSQRYSPTGLQADDTGVSSAFLVLDREGNIVTIQDSTVNGEAFTFAGQGDGTNSLQIQYDLPVVAAVTDSDGSEALTQFKIILSDTISENDGVDGGVLRFEGQDIINLFTGAQLITQVDLDIDGDGISDGVLANVSYDASSQTYTFTLNPNDAVQSITNTDQFTVTANGNQTGDFTMTVEATATELSNGDTDVGAYSIAVDRGSDAIAVIDAVGSISIDETPGVQTTDDGFGHQVDDVDLTVLTDTAIHDDTQSAFEAMQLAHGLGSPIALAHTNPGEMLYFIPGSFAADVQLTDEFGQGFNGVDTGLISQNGESIFIRSFTHSGHTFVLGQEGTDPIDASDGNVIFALYYDMGSTQFGAANDTLWLAMYDTIKHSGPGETASFSDLIHISVANQNFGYTPSTDTITITFVDGPDSPDDGVAPLMMMSSFGGGEENGVSTEDAGSSSFMTVSNDDSLTMSTVTNEDPSTINDDSEDSGAGGDALTSDMLFSSESSENPQQADQQAALDGGDSPQQEIAQQQQEQTAEPAPSAPDAIAQSMQDADQQAQSSSGG